MTYLLVVGKRCHLGEMISFKWDDVVTYVFVCVCCAFYELWWWYIYIYIYINR